MLPALARRLADSLGAHPLRLGLLAFLLSLPALFQGRIGDDWFHVAVMRGIGLANDRGPLLGLFVFMDGGPENRKMEEVGLLPWWSSPELRVSLLRPVTALTHMIDERLWPETPFLAHFQSLFWAGIGVALVALLYRRLAGVGLAAALAGLFFAVEDTHAVPFGWIANRNATVALVFGVIALLIHHKARTERSWAWGIASLPALLLSLLAGEAALGVLAYLVAWELCAAPGTRLQRFSAILPAASVVLFWRIAYNAMGFGAAASGLYVDPGHEPIRFIGTLLARWPVLFLGQWAQLPVDLWGLVTQGPQLIIASFGAFLLIFLGILFYPLLVQSPQARTWALGMALSMIPLCAAFPMERLLMVPGIGALGLLATALAHIPEQGPRRTLLLALGLFHGPLAAILLFLRTATLFGFGDVMEGGERGVPRDPALTNQSLIFLNGTDFAPVYAATIRTTRQEPGVPRRVGLLVPQTAEASLTRIDANTLEAHIPSGLFAVPLEGLLGDPTRAWRIGEQVERTDYTATILDINEDQHPTRVRFVFAEPLSSPNYRFVQITEEGIREVSDPAASGTLALPAVSPLPPGRSRAAIPAGPTPD